MKLTVLKNGNLTCLLIYYSCSIIAIPYRGDSFRKEFAKIGEVRSILPLKVNVMALTATATKSTRQVVCKKLGMRNPVVINQSPNKTNITYSVVKKEDTLEKLMMPLAEELKIKRAAMPRVIVYTRTYDACGEIYAFFKHFLGPELTEPPHLPYQLAQFRLVDMFTACTKADVKEKIILNYANPDSTLRIVIATIAFGMGLDCPNVRRIVHIGAPSDIEAYLQETGRGGRDGERCTATLYYNERDFITDTDHDRSSMKEYCKSKDVCRRQSLLKHSDCDEVVSITPPCLCCDVLCF